MVVAGLRLRPKHSAYTINTSKKVLMQEQRNDLEPTRTHLDGCRVEGYYGDRPWI